MFMVGEEGAFVDVWRIVVELGERNLKFQDLKFEIGEAEWLVARRLDVVVSANG
jgi:hypothetical protein